MWQFPALEVVEKDSKAAIAEYLRGKFRLVTKSTFLPLTKLRHSVTFRNIRLEPYVVRVDRLPRVADTRVVALAEVPTMSISNATRKIALAAVAVLVA
jgi:hypothetical protein